MFTLDLGNLLLHLGLDDKAFKQVFNSVERRFVQTGRQLESAGKKMMTHVTLPLVGLGVLGVRSFGKFDEAMAHSLAIFSNVTTDMRKQMEEMAKAISLRSTFSTEELAKAYFYLGSAGFDAEQSLKALGAVERFATAGAFDLSEATSLAADSQKALGMASSDATVNLKNMQHIMDILVGANTLANASTRQFAAALGNEAAAAMKTFNIELEEGVAILAAYAEQRTKGEEAGSAFSRMVRFLMQGYRENRKVWRDFNLELYDTETGALRLTGVIDDLTRVLGNLSPEAKSAALDMLGFKARTQQVIQPLLGMGDRIREFTEKLHQMGGVTNRIAEENLKNLWSQLKITWNWIKLAVEELGSMLAPRLLKAAAHIRDFIKWILNLNSSTRSLILNLGLLAAAFGPMAFAIGKGIQALAALRVALLSTVGVATLARATLAGVGSALAAWKLGHYLQENVQAVAEAAATMANVMYVAWETIKHWGQQAIVHLKIAWTQFKAWFSRLVGDFEMGVAVLLRETERAIYYATGRVVNLGADAAAEAATKMREAGVTNVRELLKQLTQNEIDYGDRIRAIAEGYALQLAEIQEKFQKQAANKETPLGDYLEELLRQNEEAVKKVQESLAALGKEGQSYTDLAVPGTEAERVMQQMLEDLDYEVEGIALANQGWERSGDIVAFLRAAAEAYGDDIGAITKAVEEYKEKLAEVEKLHQFDSLHQWLNDNSIQNFWRNVSDVAVRGLDSFSNALGSMMDEGRLDFGEFTRALLRDWTTMLARMTMASIAQQFFPQLTQMGVQIGTAMLGGLGGNPAVKVHTGQYLGYPPRTTIQAPILPYIMAAAQPQAIKAHSGQYLGYPARSTVHLPLTAGRPAVRAHSGQYLGYPPRSTVHSPLASVRSTIIKAHSGQYLGRSIRQTLRLPDLVPPAPAPPRFIRAHSGQYLGSSHLPTIQIPMAPRLPEPGSVTLTLPAIAHTGLRLNVPHLPTIRMPAALWDNAPRYHSGSNDEVAVWAKRNEHVLTADQMDTLVGFADRGRDGGGSPEMLASMKELIYWTRRNRIVPPVIIDKREDVATVAHRNYLKRVDVMRKGR